MTVTGVERVAVTISSEAVVDLTLGRPVRTRETKPYGCSVKYAN